MIAYGFKREFAPQIITGAATPKTITLRKERKHPSRHAHVGEPIGLWTGMRSPEATRQGVGLCVLRCIMRYGEHGIVGVSELRTSDNGGDFADAIMAELIAGERDTIARRDGFENYAAMWSWHVAERTKEEKAAGGSIARQLVAWRPLTAEQIAAIDDGSAQLSEVA